MGNEGEILQQNFTIIAYMLQSISVFMGVCFTLSGLFQLKKHGESRGMGMQKDGLIGPLLMLVCGAMLMILPEFVGAMTQAFFGYRNPMAYTGGPTGYDALVPPILMLVRIIGVGSFIRGIVLLARSGGHQSQAGTLGKAVIHMVAGIFCVHIQGTMHLLGEIMGLVN